MQKKLGSDPKLLECSRTCDTPALKVTFITEVTILEGRLWPCAAAAMLAMVLRWFIWLIAMVTEAGGRLTGIRGCGIIMKGSSSPETHEEVVGYSMARVMTDIFTGGKLANGGPARNSPPAHPPFIRRISAFPLDSPLRARSGSGVRPGGGAPAWFGAGREKETGNNLN